VSKITAEHNEIEDPLFASEVRSVYFGEQSINVCVPLQQQRDDVFAQAAKLSELVNAMIRGARVVGAHADATNNDDLLEVTSRMLSAAELVSGIATILVEEIELAGEVRFVSATRAPVPLKQRRLAS
jgi:hypothetical protein